MNSIQDMVDVNTIIGEPIETSNNTVIIPISKVCFGFAAGGSEFKGETLDEYKKDEKEEEVQYRLPFGGGSGAGVSINPVAFLVVQGNNVKLLPVSYSSAVDKLLDYVPELMDKVNGLINKGMQDKKENKNNEYEQMEPPVIKARPKPKRTKPKHQVQYEYEYDETLDDEDDDEINK